MFESWMSAPKLQRAMRAYMEKHAWRNATADDFFAALDGEGGPEISASLRTFVDQPGVPLVRADIACEADAHALALSQRRYVPSGVKLPEAQWKIPVCVRYGGPNGEGRRVCAMLDGPSARVPITGACPTWVMTNADAAGYYRSQYSSAMLATLLDGKVALMPAELASVAGDGAALVESNDLALGDTLKLLPALVVSKDRYVVESALALLRIAADIATQEQSAPLATYVRRTLGPRVRALGWARKAGETVDDELLRPRLLRLVATTGQDPELRAQARDLILRWLKDRRALEPDLVEAGLAAAAKTNDTGLFAALAAEAKKPLDRREKEQLYTALGAFTSQAFVKAAQAALSSTEVNLQDTEGILWAQLEDPTTRDAAYAFFDASFEAMASRLADDETMYLFDALGALCDEKRVEAAKAAFTPRAAKTPGAPRTLDGALERARLCLGLQRAHGAGLDGFLKRR